ncbi:MAG: hypothetical protein FWD06_00015 [Oscillospiraceae bacterium]|nr:hypothetical protein [Oscillospiraceae bacterium]
MNTQLIERLWLAFFPRRCVWCTGVTAPTEMLCPDCAEEGEKSRYACRGDRPRSPANCHPNSRATETVAPTQVLIACFVYHSRARRILLRLKFRGKRNLAHSIGYAMGDALREAGYCDDDLLFCAVPMTAAQVKKRGFNQSELLAKTAARWLGCAHATLLYKARETEVQHDLPAPQRAQNVAGAYAVIAPEQVAGRRVVLCDDICTTGATMQACAHMLEQAGAAQVIRLAFLRTEVQAKKMSG